MSSQRQGDVLKTNLPTGYQRHKNVSMLPGNNFLKSTCVIATPPPPPVNGPSLDHTLK